MPPRCTIDKKPSVVAAHSARSFCPSERVVECGLLSGLSLRHFARPLAGMVICGSDPNLMCELQRSQVFPVFLIQIGSIIAPIQVIDFSYLFHRKHRILHSIDHAAAANRFSR
jgi:hypothetical protein